MDLTGEYVIPAPRARVWAALNDPETLKRCIPGCQEIAKLSDTEMTARVSLSVGPVRATFNGKVTLSEIDPPNGYRIAGEGQGGVAGFGKGSADVKLSPEGEAATRLAYDARAQVGGKMAQIGSRLIDATAGKITDDFFKAFEAHLQAQLAPAGEVPAAPVRVAEPPGTLGWVLAALVVLATLFFVFR
jgi:hypothetical protein